MSILRRYQWPLLAVGAVVVVGAFLAFRPDKLFVDDVVDESLSDAFVITTTTITSTEPSSTIAPDASTSSTTTTTVPNETTTTQAPTPSEPVEVASWPFSGIDHSASGTATIYQKDGSHVLRFEDDTDIQNGPDLYVWLLAEDTYPGGVPADFIDLGKIKGNVGGQNYGLPPEYEPTVHRFVMIWCLRFDVPFAAAPLS